MLGFKSKNISRIKAISCALMLSVAFSCGHQNDEKQNAEIFSWKDNPVQNRFTQAEISKVYSTDTELIDGKRFPVSKPLLKNFFPFASATPEFKNEWGNFTAGGEIKGFLNLMYLPVNGLQSRLLKNFEGLRLWKSIKDTKGEVLFEDAFTTDASGKTIPDVVDGNAPATGEKIYGTLVIKSPMGGLPVPITLELFNKAGYIQADLTNRTDVSAPFVGTIIKKENLKLHMKFFPHEKGWLLFGASAVKLEKFQDMMKPEDLERLTDGLFTWIKNNTVISLPGSI